MINCPQSSVWKCRKQFRVLVKHKNTLQEEHPTNAKPLHPGALHLEQFFCTLYIISGRCITLFAFGGTGIWRRRFLKEALQVHQIIIRMISISTFSFHPCSDLENIKFSPMSSLNKKYGKISFLAKPFAISEDLYWSQEEAIAKLKKWWMILTLHFLVLPIIAYCPITLSNRSAPPIDGPINGCNYIFIIFIIKI